MESWGRCKCVYSSFLRWIPETSRTGNVLYRTICLIWKWSDVLVSRVLVGNLWHYNANSCTNKNALKSFTSFFEQRFELQLLQTLDATASSLIWCELSLNVVKLVLDLFWINWYVYYTALVLFFWNRYRYCYKPFLNYYYWKMSYYYMKLVQIC